MSYYHRGSYYRAGAYYHRGGFFDDVLSVVGTAGKALLPVAGTAVGSIFGGPVGGVVGGALGAGLASALQPAKTAAATQPGQTSLMLPSSFGPLVPSTGGRTISVGVGGPMGLAATYQGPAAPAVRTKQQAVGLRGVLQGRRHRRINPLNPRALRRALRRAKGFERFARHVLHFTSPKKHVGAFRFKRRRKAA